MKYFANIIIGLLLLTGLFANKGNIDNSKNDQAKTIKKIKMMGREIEYWLG